MNLLVDRLLECAADNGSARHEVKFLIPRHQISRLRQWILYTPLKFISPYPSRKITSLYLDSWDYRCYRDNLDGESKRVKIRIRRYGTDEVKHAILETKLRRSQTGYKLQYHIDNADLVKQIANGILSDARARDGWIKKVSELPNLPQPLALCLPVLFPTAEVAYNREYYVSMDRQIRLTIDTNIQYRRAGSMAGRMNDFLSVCEIKTNVDSDMASIFPIPSLPFKVSRNSKYCRAVSSVCKDTMLRRQWEPYF